MGVQRLGKEVRFLVPSLRNSDRQRHDPTQWEWLENQMFVEFPEGWKERHFLRTETGILGTIVGHWFDKEKNEGIPDESIELVVAIMPERMTILFQFFEGFCVT